MTSKYHRAATAEDAAYVAANLRADDRAECLASSGMQPEDYLPIAVQFNGAEAVLAPDGKEVIGLCGVTVGGGVWFLGTDAVSRHRSRFLRESRKWLEEKHKSFARMGNAVDARNVLHIRWLCLLGFQFTGLVERSGLPFITFEKTSCATPPLY